MATSAKIKYKGDADVRVLRKQDLVSMGLPESSEYSATRFNRHEPTEVPSEVAKILLSHRDIQGEFVEQVDEPTDKPADSSPTEKSASKK